MDWDADGILDFVSGSYDPGDLYLFRGLGEGRFAAVAPLRDAEGTPLVHHPEEMKQYQEYKDPYDEAAIPVRVASFGSWPEVVDWDADGDLDVLIGTFGGDVFLRRNTGTRAAPVFSPESVPVQAAGAPLHVNAHAAPVAADWDEDGTWDLVVGASDGSVGWFPNTGTAAAPAFGAYRRLVPPRAAHKFLTRYVEPGATAGPGVRAQIDVVDYDGDGHLDLLVGDYVTVQLLRKLTAEERQEVAEREALQQRLLERITAATDEQERQRLGEAFDAQQSFGEKWKAGERRTVSRVWWYRRQVAAAPR